MKRVWLIGLLWLLSGNIGQGQTAQHMLEVTNAFLATLDEEKCALVQYDFEDSLRTNWTNLPIGMAKRPGIGYGDLSEESKIEFHNILTSLFSSQGYLKITSIMNLDDILNIVYETARQRGLVSNAVLAEIKALEWDFNNYYLTIWGSPHKTEPWGLKFEGHHISINLSAVGSQISVNPLFLGTDPAEVQITKYAGQRVLSKEEDYGFQLINSLSDEQKKIAALSQAVPQDIITNPNSPQRISNYYGLKAANLTKHQKQLLVILISEFVNNLEHEKSHAAMDKIKKFGIDAIYFAWIGSFERKKPHYYIINGPDFIIEYDNANNKGNHIHTIWREKGNDFGEDILKTHYSEHKH